ncbi:carbamoyl phosphate synthase-like protein [Corynebacterium glaucum]|uniref:Carbamoyl phosphate synthase-like protein n=1 Tax=Corynebacterium glaucum TaxID=187491 RepID=A0A1Q2HUS6_9CORY|nr:ATP-grasp domain-containing protein [Corynebacterium glaucum]AQQ14597.1 carbamoyl phosphate synthase-like protein [Corynebacterium glaucum]
MTTTNPTYAADQRPHLPVVVKPRVSRGGRGVEVVETQDRFTEITDPGLIVQEFAPGEEFCPQLFISPTTGETEVVVLHKTAMKEGRVGNAAAVERATDQAVADLARETASAIGLTGPLDMDIRYTEAGRPVLLEVNARFGANSEHAPEILAAFLEEVA